MKKVNKKCSSCLANYCNLECGNCKGCICNECSKNYFTLCNECFMIEQMDKYWGQEAVDTCWDLE